MSKQNIQGNPVPQVKGPGKKKKIIWLVAAIILVMVAAAILFFRIPDKKEKSNNGNVVEDQQNMEPRFVKEGELFFLDPADTNKHKKIDIEIAEDEASRNRGLMFRRSMADTQGMLFIFEDARPRSFWMENTHIPLDIIFVSSNMEILNIQKNTVPFSEAPVPSEGNARYVIEVNAGFADNYGIKPGNKIRFNGQ